MLSYAPVSMFSKLSHFLSQRLFASPTRLRPQPPTSRPECNREPKASFPVCQPVWFGQECADESFKTQDWSEFIALNEPANTQDIRLFSGGLTDATVDLTITDFLQAGNLAFVAIVDLDQFSQLEPQVFADAMAILQDPNCPEPLPDQCKQRLSKVIARANTDNIKRASLWWHGCQGANDATGTKTLNGVTPPLYGFAVAAQANSGSEASINVSVDHHSIMPTPQVSRTCGPRRTGRLAEGTYNHTLLGVLPMPTPQHGGTLSTPTGSAGSTIAFGTFEVTPNGAVFFTGTADLGRCQGQ